jgi:hypothetical protein
MQYALYRLVIHESHPYHEAADGKPAPPRRHEEHFRLLLLQPPELMPLLLHHSLSVAHSKLLQLVGRADLLLQLHFWSRVFAVGGGTKGCTEGMLSTIAR